MIKNIQELHQFLPSINGASRSKNHFCETMGLLGVAIYAFSFPFSKDLCYVGEWLMLGAFVLSLPHIWPIMKNDPLWIAFVAFLIFMLFKAILTLVAYSGELGEVLNAIRWRARFFWLFIVAWWVGGTKSSILRLMAFALVGFFILLLIGYEPHLFQKIMRGMRVGFGLNPQHFSLFAATALCGCLFFAKNFWGTRYRYARIVIWSLLVSWLLVLIIASQVRATWIAVIAVLVSSGTYALFAVLFNEAKKRSMHMVLGLIFLGVLLGVGYHFFHEPLHNRVYRDWDSVNNMISSGFENIDPTTSSGIRMTLWKWAVDKIKQHPIVGWKIDNSSRDYLGKEGLDKRVAKFHHVHNSYLEILLNQGVLGFALFLFFPCYVIFSVSSCYRREKIPFHYYAFFLSVVILFSIVNLFEAYFTTWLFWPYFSVFWGGFYSFALWSRKNP
ncbi:O-antigen ligase family protein [Desulfatitalea tepidiphila]|uniref:O-antigen ligase family protein n=1 Tax=Desulfatitalea tepidiphila TaxID=1185843 RepID=UPI0006B6118C|nr:O-antigen ligase family protein [Desulfatitalea tepidiphila]